MSTMARALTQLKRCLGVMLARVGTKCRGLLAARPIVLWPLQLHVALNASFQSAHWMVWSTLPFTKDLDTKPPSCYHLANGSSRRVTQAATGGLALICKSFGQTGLCCSSSDLEAAVGRSLLQIPYSWHSTSPAPIMISAQISTTVRQITAANRAGALGTAPIAVCATTHSLFRWLIVY